MMNDLIKTEEFDALLPYIMEINSDRYIKINIPKHLVIDLDRMRMFFEDIKIIDITDSYKAYYIFNVMPIKFSGKVKDEKLFEYIKNTCFQNLTGRFIYEDAIAPKDNQADKLKLTDNENK